MIFEYFTLNRRRRDYEIVLDPRLPLQAGLDFPQEMIEDIISRLHPKELCTYKTVSKGFNQLISSKSFLMKNLNKLAILDRAIYIFQKDFAYAPLYYNRSGLENAINGRVSSPENRDVEILTSSEGLVLFCDCLDDFYLFNPTSNKARVLPTTKLNYPTNCTTAQVFFGMGYLYEEDDYKIVRISTFDVDIDGRTEVQVYSKNLGEWHRAADFPSHNPITQAGVHVCGRVHWKTKASDTQSYITAFDLRHETYSTISVPNVPTSYVIQHLVSLDNKTLALSCSLLQERAIHTLWILKNYCDDSSWCKLNIDLATVGDHFGLMTLRPLSFIHQCNSAILVHVDPSGVFGIYDIEARTFHRVGDGGWARASCVRIVSSHPCTHLIQHNRKILHVDSFSL